MIRKRLNRLSGKGFPLKEFYGSTGGVVVCRVKLYPDTTLMEHFKILVLALGNYRRVLMQCDHESNKKDWAKMQNGIMKLHPYCNECGTLKNVSSDKGKKLSYFVIALSRLRKILEEKGYKVSETQIRLIVKELSEIDGFDDVWWITFSKQKEIFIQTVRKYIRVSRELLETVINDITCGQKRSRQKTLYYAGIMKK